MQATADIPTGTLEEGPIGFTKPWKCAFHPGMLTELPLSLSTGVDILIEDEKRIVMMLNRDGLHKLWRQWHAKRYSEANHLQL